MQRPETPTLDTLTFDVEGMTCASCVTRIERILGRQDGVDAASVNLANRSATVRVDGAINAGRLEEAVGAIGYGMALRTGEERPNLTDAYDAEAAAQWRRFWMAAALSAPLMVLAMSYLAFLVYPAIGALNVTG